MQNEMALEEGFAILALVIVMLIVPFLMNPALPDRTTRFTSDQERRLWIGVLVVLMAIYATLAPVQVLAETLRERNLLRLTGGILLLLVSVVAGIRWAKRRPGGREIGVVIGLTVVYLMALIRIASWEERSHLFEYGLVGALIYQALSERRRNGGRVPVPALVAVAATALLGWIDEGIQALLPSRVYDIRDVGFNALAGLMAVSSSVALGLARRKASAALDEDAAGKS